MKKIILISLLVFVGCGGPVPVLEHNTKALTTDIPPDEQLKRDIPPDEQVTSDIPPDEQLTGDAGPRKPPVCVNCSQ